MRNTNVITVAFMQAMTKVMRSDHTVCHSLGLQSIKPVWRVGLLIHQHTTHNVRSCAQPQMDYI